jgi:hypothetical protein
MFQIFRHRNRVVVDQFMEHAKEEFDPQKNLANQSSISAEHLKIMQSLARMRETADRSDMGFFASFVTPEGYHYSTSNLEGESTEEEEVQYLVKLMVDHNYQLGEMYQRIQIVQTEEGIQLRLIDEP